VVFRELAKGNLKLEDMVTVSEKAWRTEGSRMFAQVGAQISVENLLKGMIVQSGNDASVALAEQVAGDEAVFAQLMNQNAERLGMKNTHFKNSMGLPDPEHYTTAHDLFLLTQALIEEFPEYYKWHAMKEFLFNGIKQTNRNRLLWRDPTVDGVKTGHTEGAGYCLVTSALREGMRLIAVVLGTKSDNERANANQTLLNYGFRFYETRPLYKANEKLTEARVWKGETTMAELGLAKDFYVTFPRGQYANLKATMEVNNSATAPVQQGDKLGAVKVVLNDQPVGDIDLTALKAIPEGGLFRRALDSLQLMFK
jgi:D-alanyl-D-alanine carboxypeptidase (penicillin-binding protein 5/6)